MECQIDHTLLLCSTAHTWVAAEAHSAFPVIPKEHTKLSPGMASTQVNMKQGQTPAGAQVCALNTLQV